VEREDIVKHSTTRMRKPGVFFGVALCVLMLSLPMFTQTGTGRIGGVVKDQTGAPIAGASVTVTDVARRLTRNLATDESGAYSAPNLLPGTYTVYVASTAGFQAWERTNILLRTGDNLEIDLILQPGAQTPSVTISGGPIWSDLKVFCSNGVKAAIEELRPQMERTAGRPLTIVFDSTGRLTQRIDRREAFDVVIIGADGVQALAQRSIVAADPRADIGRTGVGIGVRAGARKPDISTPEALKQTLLNARSIAMNPTGASINYFNRAVERLGIAEAVKPKLMLDAEPGRPQTNVAEGKAELVWTQIPEIRFFPGLELAGTLPAEFQGYTNFAAGVSAKSANPAAASAVVRFLTTPEAIAVLRSKSVEAR
jgi:molybdate transport system substrate-binding protein